MPSTSKPQRIRDPLHNLIEFGVDPFERNMWDVIETKPFQRLRRVRQLGFSELVFPGATHTRFIHSIGVFHTARQLMQIIKLHMGDNFESRKYEVALAAALVHDVGHGMFSHAFEEIGKELNLPMARHEDVSEQLIRDGEIAEVLTRGVGNGFADDVADLLKQETPRSLYDSVVSSQFDADRLDYMQRDRQMTGVQSSGVDATWLMANLEIGSVPISTDEQQTGTIDTLVLGPKAFHAAENYVLSLFQLYPNVYLHKTTRGAEKLFSCLMLRVISLVRDGHEDKTGLPKNHPFCLFAKEPDQIKLALNLDDTVFWGALPMMVDAEDSLVKKCAVGLKERKLPKCVDIRHRVALLNPMELGLSREDRNAYVAQLNLYCKRIAEKIKSLAAEQSEDKGLIFVDESKRNPYKKFESSQTPLNQILIRQGDGSCADMAHLSSVVSGAETFEVCRAYYFPDDKEGKDMIEEQIKNIAGDNNAKI